MAGRNSDVPLLTDESAEELRYFVNPSANVGLRVGSAAAVNCAHQEEFLMDQNAVFYHIGGVMMEDEQKRRCWVNDPPGWYFWSHIQAGARRLHGPYDSREQADEEVESFHGAVVCLHPMGRRTEPRPQPKVLAQRIFGLFSSK